LLLPWLANITFLARISPFKQLDLSPIAFAISALLLAVAIFRFRLFDLVPVIDPTIISRLDAAAFVVDSQNRILDLNVGARSLLSDRQTKPEGTEIGDAFRWWLDIDKDLRDEIEVNRDIPVMLNGLRRYLNIQITPIWNTRSKVTARLIIIRDITGDKLAGEAMALAQVKTEFLAKVGHELRSPLTSILGVAEMLDYGVYGPLTDDQHDAVRMISDSTQHMTRMVNDLLQQSKLERGTFKLDITEFQIADLLNRVIEHFKPMARIKGLRLKLQLEPEIPEKIRSDSLRLYQILVNLMDNAIKYTLEGEIILIANQPDPGHIAFKVIDTGVGIPKDVQSLIFNPFQQASANSSHKESGFGLGLSIVKQLVSLMDGKIDLKSEVGKGSTFTVVLALEPNRENME
jgi:signal transduction histidine kinase